MRFSLFSFAGIVCASVLVVGSDSDPEAEIGKQIRSLKKSKQAYMEKLERVLELVAERTAELEEKLNRLTRKDEELSNALGELRKELKSVKAAQAEAASRRLQQKEAKEEEKPAPAEGRRQVVLGLLVEQTTMGRPGGEQVLLVKKVEDGFTGDAAGLEPGDIILRFGGEEIRKLSALASLLKQVKTGDVFTITFKKADGPVVQAEVKGSHLRDGAELVKRKKIEPERRIPGVDKPKQGEKPGKPETPEGSGKTAPGEEKLKAPGHGAGRVDLGVICKTGGEEELEVTAVLKGSPAATSGVRPGDVIRSVAGKEVHSVSELDRVLNELYGKKDFKIGITRADGTKEMLKVLLTGGNGARKEKESPDEGGRPPGAGAEDSGRREETDSGERPVRLGIVVEEGEEILRISEVVPGGPCGGKLMKGDVISSFAGKRVRTLKQMKEVVGKLSPGREVTVKVFRKGEEVELSITPGAGSE